MEGKVEEAGPMDEQLKLRLSLRENTKPVVKFTASRLRYRVH